jgi:FMN-dependent oxidoreductase (nitrilotriacetate monooxygenase family)
MFHMAFFQSGSGVHWAWQEKAAGGAAGWRDPSYFIDNARALERACFEYILFEDNSYIPDRYKDSMDFYLTNGLASPRQDPLVLATIVSQHTSKIGLVPTVPTFAYHPYSVARILGTLDQYSNGRAGWNMVTGTSVRAMQNYGREDMDPHDTRYDIADEYTEIVNQLSLSFDVDAVVDDRANGVFVDPAKVRHIDFQGQHFSSRGPLNSGPLVQGTPVLAQAGSSPRGRQFAAQHSDTIVASERSVEKMKAFRDDVRRRAIEIGRDPNEIKVLFIASPIFGRTDGEAQAFYEEVQAEGMAKAEYALATLSKTTDIDFGQFPLDEPLTTEGLSTNGTQASLYDFIERNEGRTLREAGAITWSAGRGAHGLVGTYDTVAARMAEIIQEVGGDGFLIGNPVVPGRRGILDLTEGLMPALQSRGVVRSELEGRTLRENLRAF